LAGLFFALAIFSKPPNILHIGMLFLLLLYKKDWKKFINIALICLLVLIGLIYFNYIQTGAFNFMGGERRSFYGNFPFERPDFTFAGGFPMSSDNYWSRFHLSPAIALLNLFYYIFGRFTGMIIYFPSALFLFLLFFFQKKKPEDWFLLAAIGAAILVYILGTPDNYFGGSGSLGNRYFFNIFPLFFFLGYRGRTFKFSLLPVFVAVLFLAPVYMDSFYHSASPRFPGVSFPAKFFPPEKTQYSTLPSNNNPRSFNKHIGDKYTLFFLNDNYNPIEGELFWTNSDQELELFLLAPRQVKTFHIQLKNIPLANQIRFQIEHKIRKVFIAADSVREITFSNIPGLCVGRRYLYHIKIKSQHSYCPYFANVNSLDQRWLGVQTHIELDY
jgi:ABC-type cobalt transport system substrate-binding protein